jgi:DNA mismatch endonuclease (patch repair protein)
MRRIRSKDTAPEMIVRRLVHSLGFRYRLHDHKLPGRPDLVFRRQKKIIQVYGCFWHSHKDCRVSHIPATRKTYWKPKLERNKIRDKEHSRRLKQMGWSTLIIWECEVREGKAFGNRIKSFLTEPI